MPTLLVGDGSAVLVGSDPIFIGGRARSPRIGGFEPSLIGCNIGCSGSGVKIGCVDDADVQAEAAGVWIKTHFHQDGPFLCATVYSVSAGEPKIVELRVDMRPIARALVRAHAALHAQQFASSAAGGTTVGWGLGKLWKKAKKAAKSIGRVKLVKGVVGVTKTIAKTAKKVIKSKVTGLVAAGLAAFPLTAPIGIAALGAYAAANTALAGVEAGRKVVKTAQTAAGVINQGARAARAVTSSNQRTAAAVKTAGALMPAQQKAAVAARVKAAGKLQLNAKGKATVAATLAKAPAAARAKVAKAMASKLKGLATLKSRAALAKSLPPTASAAVVSATKLQVAASPVIAQAKALQAKLADPKVRAQLVSIRARAEKSRAALVSVANAAKGGDLDAQKSAAIVNLVARNRARIQGMSQANAGGLPGVLITKDGKLRRGRWRVQATAAAGGTLYTGPKKPTEKGTFQTVSGDDGTVFIGCCGSTRVVAGPNSPVALVGRALRSVRSAVGMTLFGEPVQLESGEGTELESVAVDGQLPLDGTRMFGKGANQSGLGVYEVGSRVGLESYDDDPEVGGLSRGRSRARGPLIGCGTDTPCAPCSAARG